jgi:CubicO group peptidase (beta-lactamase class C family)
MRIDSCARWLFWFFASIACFPVWAGNIDLEPIRQKYGVPALGLTVLDHGVSTQAIVGVRKLGETTPAQLGDQFHLGSCTKAMTATLLAIAIERGSLHWDDKLGDLLPELRPAMDPAFREARLDWLTAMHSGLSADFDPTLARRLYEPPYDRDPSAGRDLVARTLLAQPPATPPGSAYAYANASYIIAGRILERLYSVSWEELIRREIFAPLGMHSCGFGPQASPAIDPPDQPWPHTLQNGVFTPVTPGPFSDNPPAFGPAGTVHCSMADWGKFLALHLAGARGQDTVLLKAASFKKLHENYPDKTYTYGGWGRYDTGSGFDLSYAGSNTYNFAEVWLYPGADLAVFAVTNSGAGGQTLSDADRSSKAVSDAIAAVVSAPARAR